MNDSDLPIQGDPEAVRDRKQDEAMERYRAEAASHQAEIGRLFGRMIDESMEAQAEYERELAGPTVREYPEPMEGVTTSRNCGFCKYWKGHGHRRAGREARDCCRYGHNCDSKRYCSEECEPRVVVDEILEVCEKFDTGRGE